MAGGHPFDQPPGGSGDVGHNRIEPGSDFFVADLVVACSLRQSEGRTAVTGMELLGLGLSASLLVYLFVSLVKPEWFA